MNGRTKASDWIETLIKQFVKESPENDLGFIDSEKAWGTPLVGASKGDDPLYGFFKEDIGEYYWTPFDAFHRAFPDKPVSSSELSVISWILPQTEATKTDHRMETTYPSERWVRSRSFGQDFNDALARYVVSSLTAEGIDSVAPSLSPEHETFDSEKYTFSSNWSERHAAYVCGLGTFGLCDGLITEVGKAMRCGSVVARVTLEATPRPYADHHAYCLFYKTGGCMKCAERCPVGAITAEGHDKVKCRNWVKGVIPEYSRSVYNVNAYGCGLCQVDVPCESCVPKVNE